MKNVDEINQKNVGITLYSNCQRCVLVVDTAQSFVQKSPKALRYEQYRMKGHRARSFDNISLLSGV